MSAKEALRDLVEAMSEEDALRQLERIELEFMVADRRLTPDEIAAIEQGLADADAGRRVTTAQLRERFGLPA
jgi:predicted transcriptional regulator